VKGNCTGVLLSDKEIRALVPGSILALLN